MIGISKLYCGAVEPSDLLRYARRDPNLPSHLLQCSADHKPIVVWNVTRRCNLACLHCYAGATVNQTADDELTTDEGLALLDDLAHMSVPVVLFSGGEPLCRPDLLTLIAHARQLGLRAVLSTNGALIDPPLARRLARAGLSYVGVSLDGLQPTHDAFRRAPGAFHAALAGIRHCRDAGLKVGLRLTLHRGNLADLPGIFQLLIEHDIPRACFYHLVYTGRAAQLRHEDLDHAQTRRAVDLIIDRTADLHRQNLPKEILTVDNHADGPYLYLRMLRENHPRAAAVLELLRMNGGNSSGVRLACVGWNGQVHPDQFWRRHAFGNVRQRPFSTIWRDDTHELLARLRRRRPFLKGRCALCRFLDLCNGNFRARAEAAAADPWAPDPACYLTDDEIATPPAPPTINPARQAGVSAPAPYAPGGIPAHPVPPPRLIAWELTRRCPLRCRHCRAAAQDRPYPDELTTADCRAVLDNIAAFARPTIILTGGEPLLRDDVYDLARRGHDLGLRLVIAVCGALLDDSAARRLKDAGVACLSISLDGATPASHDAFRGVPGAFAAARAALETARRHGLNVQINTTISRHNLDELPDLLRLAESLGADAWNPFLLVPTGRARQLADHQLSPDQYEQVLHWLKDRQAQTALTIRVTCAPHYQRVLRQPDHLPTPPTALPADGQGCLGGKSFAFISHTGRVQICGFLDLPAGHLRPAAWNFQKIWTQSPLLRQIRDVDRYRGKCGRCAYRRLCGGCRARAYALTGDPLAPEPFCIYQPDQPTPRQP